MEQLTSYLWNAPSFLQMEILKFFPCWPDAIGADIHGSAAIFKMNDGTWQRQWLPAPYKILPEPPYFLADYCLPL